MAKAFLDLDGLTVYDEEIKNYTGALSDLETTAKSDLVSAINEAAQSKNTFEVDIDGNLIIS